MATTTNVVRVTKSQKLEALKSMLNHEAVKTFTAEDKESYTFNCAEATDFINELIEQLNKKTRGNTKASKEAAEQNEEFKTQILEFLVDNSENKEDGYTCGEILRGVPAILEAGFQVQKVAFLMKELEANGDVVSKKGSKNRTMFRIA